MTNTITLKDKSIPKPFLFLAVLLFLLPSSFVIIESGHVGVVKKLGAVQPDALKEGFHLKIPFVDKIIQMDIRIITAKSSALSASKDLQTVKTVVTVQASLSGKLAPEIYQKIGRENIVLATIVEPGIQESVKAVTAKYTAEQLVTKREEVKLQIHQAIQEFIDVTFSEKGIANGLHIANVAITDFNFSEEFNRAIELKVRAEQEALQAKNEKLRRVTQAEAAAREKILASDAMAYEITVSSKARAEAIKREANALKNHPELIQLRIAEKWNGVLPKFSGSNAIPLLNIGEKN